MYSKTTFQNIGKLFSKYELLFLHQANSEFDNHVLYMLAWVAWVVCLDGWHASVGGVLE